MYKMNVHDYCVIMAGGGGFRFWPIGRETRPKQFLDLAGTGCPLLKSNFDRASNIVPKENILVVTLSKYKDYVKQAIPEIREENILLEPYGRHTAPCIAYATYKILMRDPDAVFVAMPSDIMLGSEDNFETTLKEALEYAGGHKALITLGIVPNKPDSNLGYIQVKGGRNSYKSNIPSKVKTFTEKPDEELAEVFIRSGEFLWNSGIFVWQASVIKEEMERHIPQITKLFKGCEEYFESETEAPFLERIYGDMDKISIDYGVMEKTEIAWVYPTHFGWTDLNKWDSLNEILQKDASGNILKSDIELCEDNVNSIIATTSKDKLMLVKGLDNFIVIDTPDVLMICPNDNDVLKKNRIMLGSAEFEKYR